MMFMPNVRGNFIQLASNQIVSIELQLSPQFCKLVEIGSYKIIAKREMKIPGSEKEFTVFSNYLTVRVIPDQK